jgi:hypothetical protein
MNEMNGVGAFDSAKSLCEASDFVAVGALPDESFAAFAELSILRNFARVGVDCVTVESEVDTVVVVFGEGRLWGMGVGEKDHARTVGHVS